MFSTTRLSRAAKSVCCQCQENTHIVGVVYGEGAREYHTRTLEDCDCALRYVYARCMRIVLFQIE